MTAVVIALLVAFFIALAAVMLLQEARTRREPAAPTYVINDAVDHAIDTLDESVLERVRRAGVRRIIEWSVHYLQGLADRGARRKGVTVVAGGEGNAIEYICAELARRGHEYSPQDVEAVLATEADYLRSIGALGDPVDEAELA